MNLEAVANLAQQALMTAWSISAPVLIAGLLVGFLISIFQAVTQIHEMTLTFIPKIFAAVLAVALSWDKMITAMIQFAERMFTDWNMFLP